MILVRHGEIYTKSDYVRHQMISHLANNLRKALPDCRVVSRRWRLETHCRPDKETTAARKIARTFGVASFSIAQRVRATPQLGGIKRAALEEAKKAGLREGKSFAVRAKRLSKEFPKDSITINREVGEFLRKRTGAKVDLSNPEVEVFIEVYGGKAYVFSKMLAGPGGLPLGSAGRMLLLLEDSNTPLAGWMMLKRGAKLVASYSRETQKSLAKQLQKWTLAAPILFFKRPKEDVVRWKKCLAVVTSTRSLRKFAKLRARFSAPVYAPLIGMTEKRLKALRQKVIKSGR
ncbi:hypothetical protein HY546_00905 [archaeon]|nr:hypothetical protein [archaeon]